MLRQKTLPRAIRPFLQHLLLLQLGQTLLVVKQTFHRLRERQLAQLLLALLRQARQALTLVLHSLPDSRVLLVARTKDSLASQTGILFQQMLRQRRAELLMRLTDFEQHQNTSMAAM
jgi:hypothetical protein